MKSTAPTTQDERRIDCPRWHSPLWFVTPGGIECRCRSCRGARHVTSWAEIDKMRAELEQSPAQAIAIA